MKPSMMKAWYAQFADRGKTGGFKHNSALFTDEAANSKTIFTKLGAQLAKIMLTKMFELTPEAQEELRKVDGYGFDIFKLRKYTDNNELTVILPWVLAKHGLIGSCSVDFTNLMCFVRSLAAGYKTITYHNQTHAADVCQTFNYFAVEGGVKDKIKLDNLEQMSCYISAALHDFEHPGVTNVFLVSMNDKIAVRHNDVSVLENHHLAASFRLMTKDENCNWQVRMSRADFKRVRQVIIQTVLSTDMTKHFTELGHLNSRMRDEDFDPVAEAKDKELFIGFMFHLSDISNPAKPWELCRLWADLIFVEFF